MTRQELARLLREQGIRPRRRLGQHFLVDEGVALRIVAAAAEEASYPAIEIGPGFGALTLRLAGRLPGVVAIERDQRLAAWLRQATAQAPSVQVVCEDVRRVDVGVCLDRLARAIGAGAVRQAIVVGNLPYAITTPILEWLIAQRLWLHRALLTMQREVAQRLCASPGSKRYGSLSCFLQYHFQPSILMAIPASAFHPRPQVESSLVRLDPHPEPPVRVSDEAWLFRVIRAAFAQRRKTLLNALVGGSRLPRATVAAALEAAGIDPNRRGETLSLADFARVAERLR